MAADMTAYLAGRVTLGDTLENLRAFDQAASILRGEGWDVYSPVEHPRSGEVMQESQRLGVRYADGPLYRALMVDFYREIITRRQMFVLPGWHRATGAISEAFLAQRCGKPIVLFGRTPMERRAVNPLFSLDVYEQSRPAVHHPRAMEALGVAERASFRAPRNSTVSGA